MRIYLAGTPVSKPNEEQELSKLFSKGSKLHSFYHCVDGFEKNWFMENFKNKCDLFIDSGAFSAWSQGVEIDIKNYIDFINQHHKNISIYANLDVIGDASATLKNQKIMEKAGLQPIPTFHFNEDVKYLKYYIDKYDYIALGGMVGRPSKDLRAWLDYIFDRYICKKDGFPRVKVHGFGLTSLKLMLRYPWFSVDSTSWVVLGRMGGIYVPRFVNDKYDYDKPAIKVSVSVRSPKRKLKGQHFENMSPMSKKKILKYVKSKGFNMGKSIVKKVSKGYELGENEKWQNKEKTHIEVIKEVGLCNTYQLRDKLNVAYFQDLQSNYKKWPWPFKGCGLTPLI